MTDFVSNDMLKNLWDIERDYTGYGKLSLSPKFLNYFSDEIRFQLTESLSLNAAIDLSLKKLMCSSPYEFKEESKVLDYIHTNKDIYLAVLDSITASADMFPGSKRVLSLYKDAEADDEFLVLSIGFETYPLNLFESMQSLKQKFLPNLEKSASGWISVIPEHIL